MINGPIEQLPLERAFLIAALRAVISGENSVVKRNSIDWAVMADEAWHHGVGPQLWRFLESSGSAVVPAQIRDSLQTAFQSNLKRNLRLTGDLWQLMELFKSRGIAAVPFKGPTLAMLAYGDLAWRDFTDLDILVEERDLPKIGELLVSAGYRPQMELSVLANPVFRAIEREYYFVHARSGTLIDLQWRLSSSILPFDLKMKQIREHQLSVRPGGKVIATFRLEDLLLYVCAHGTRHHWERLGWIADVAGLINLHPELDWDVTLEQARARRCERVLLHSLLLAIDLLGARVPRVIERLARSDADSCALAVSIHRMLAQPLGSSMSKRELHGYFLRLQKGPADRFHHLWRMMFTATVMDWEFCRLPRVLTFLYPFIRPIRLIAERLPFYSLSKSSH